MATVPVTTVKMDLHVRTTLTAGWVTGCFPVKSTSNLTFSWRNPTFYVSLLLLMLYTGSEVCVLVARRSEIASAQLSKVIMQYLVGVSNCISCFALRTWNLWSCSSLADLILRTVTLKSESSCKKGTYIIRYYILGYILLVINVIPSAILVFEFLAGSSHNSDAYFAYNFGFMTLESWAGAIIYIFSHLVFTLAAYFALSISVSIGVDLLHAYENFCYNLQKLYCIEAVSNVHIIHDDDEQDLEILSEGLNEETDTKEDVAEAETGSRNKYLHSFEEILGSAKLFQNKTKDQETVFAGKQAPVFPLKKELWATTTSAQRLQHAEGRLSLKELSENFLNIQKCFDDFNQVSGPLLFVLISHATISLIHKLFAIASSEFSNLDGTYDLVDFACKSLASFLMIASLAHIGEIITVKMRKWKEQLKCIMLTELLCDLPHDSTNTLTESMVKWDWELSAMNLFSINHALLPAIAGTMVTYLIVIIQLKVSESSSGNSGTPLTPTTTNPVSL